MLGLLGYLKTITSFLFGSPILYESRSTTRNCPEANVGSMEAPLTINGSATKYRIGRAIMRAIIIVCVHSRAICQLDCFCTLSSGFMALLYYEYWFRTSHLFLEYFFGFIVESHKLFYRICADIYETK